MGKNVPNHQPAIINPLVQLFLCLCGCEKGGLCTKISLGHQLSTSHSWINKFPWRMNLKKAEWEFPEDHVTMFEDQKPKGYKDLTNVPSGKPTDLWKIAMFNG